MKILLLAHEKDDHAAPVHWALTQAGYQTECHGGVSAAAGEHASLIFNQQPAVLLGTMIVKRGDTVWLREPNLPVSEPTVSPRTKFLGFWHEIVAMLERLPARCINKPSATNLIINKAVQLLLAGKAGLRVPATVMSNSPAAVREFFDGYPDSAVCKPFVPHIWQRQDSKDTAVAETFPLTREQLPADEVFTYAPAIYQQRIDKQFDVRTVLMARRIYSFALRTPANSLDWRFDAAINNLDVQIIATPAEVENGLLNFAQASGVCFGSVDFAVDRHGQWWFLEINEEGQFLWLEQYNPQAALLQKFCAFLTADEESSGPLEARQELFPSFLDYDRAHPNRETMDFRTATADTPFKSVEP
jgi:hypothetical protein